MTGARFLKYQLFLTGCVLYPHFRSDHYIIEKEEVWEKPVVFFKMKMEVVDHLLTQFWISLSSSAKEIIVYYKKKILTYVKCMALFLFNV